MINGTLVIQKSLYRRVLRIINQKMDNSNSAIFSETSDDGNTALVTPGEGQRPLSIRQACRVSRISNTSLWTKW